MRKSFRGVVCVILAVAAMAWGGMALAQGRAVKALVVERCAGSCHDLAPLADRVGKADKAEWNALVIRMMDYGTPLTGEERQRMVEYLTSLGSPADLN